MASQYQAAVVQLCSDEDVDSNLQKILHYIEEGAQQKAKWISFPENCLFAAPLEVRRPRFDLDSSILRQLCESAEKHALFILLGSLPLASPDPERVYNSSLLIDPHGKLAAVYRKMHLFDVELADGKTLQESSQVVAGHRSVVVETVIGRIGLSICYDLRFPELYRQLSDKGAQILTAPSAFTPSTGQAHWSTLLQARAVENLAYMIAPAQVGSHGEGSESYGHSMIIDPWGEVLAELDGDSEGLAVATVDLEKQKIYASRFPALQHRKSFT